MIKIYDRIYFKILVLWFDREMSKVKVTSLTLNNSWLFVKSENQKISEDYEIIYSKTREKMKFIHIKFMIFWEELDLLWIIENQR